MITAFVQHSSHAQRTRSRRWDTRWRAPPHLQRPWRCIWRRLLASWRGWTGPMAARQRRAQNSRFRSCKTRRSTSFSSCQTQSRRAARAVAYRLDAGAGRHWHRPDGSRRAVGLDYHSRRTHDAACREHPGDDGATERFGSAQFRDCTLWLIRRTQAANRMRRAMRVVCDSLSEFLYAVALYQQAPNDSTSIRTVASKARIVSENADAMAAALFAGARGAQACSNLMMSLWRKGAELDMFLGTALTGGFPSDARHACAGAVHRLTPLQRTVQNTARGADETLQDVGRPRKSLGSCHHFDADGACGRMRHDPAHRKERRRRRAVGGERAGQSARRGAGAAAGACQAAGSDADSAARVVSRGCRAGAEGRHAQRRICCSRLCQGAVLELLKTRTKALVDCVSGTLKALQTVDDATARLPRAIELLHAAVETELR